MNNVGYDRIAHKGYVPYKNNVPLCFIHSLVHGESSHKKLNLHYKVQVSLSNRDAVYVNIKQKKTKNERSIKSYFSISGWQELFKSHNIQCVANVFCCCCYC